MRKIEEKILRKLYGGGGDFEVGNTRFEISNPPHYATLYLHNNPIIRYKYIEGEFIPTHISICNHPTNVTKSRLNSLVRNIRVRSRRNKAYVTWLSMGGLIEEELVGDNWVQILDNYQLTLFDNYLYD